MLNFEGYDSCILDSVVGLLLNVELFAPSSITLMERYTPFCRYILPLMFCFATVSSVAGFLGYWQCFTFFSSPLDKWTLEIFYFYWLETDIIIHSNRKSNLMEHLT